MTTENFRDLGLAEPILRALEAQNFTTPTPIQAKAIPIILQGRDLLGIAQTGTGKTAAFGLPVLHQLGEEKVTLGRGGCRVLILAPTRELAIQIEQNLRSFAKEMRLRIVAILGGVSRKGQVDKLSRGADIVIGTPGRVVDLMSTRDLVLNQVTHFVLDEADRMLDLGFIKDIRRVVSALPQQRQSLLFSATMPDDVSGLAHSILNEPQRVEIARQGATPAEIDQRVYFLGAAEKRTMLVDLLQDPSITRAIVFTRTKHGANKVTEFLNKAGYDADALHGNKSQAARQKALDRFRSGDSRLLVATDIAARGIDVSEISHVFNFEMPNLAETYVHRIGRTARAGASGIAIAFCEPNETSYLRDIERLIGRELDLAGGTRPSVMNGKLPVPAKMGRGGGGGRPSANKSGGGQHAGANKRPGAGAGAGKPSTKATRGRERRRYGEAAA
ncbi:ATP-dependent RNA helicase RhlE [Faunimonas pinastri]|uniref:DEAD-box ATP-dependent RNA helicase RhpA n=1 Tax=Faunimonas pinastri TaxID=1855383 RepID=A0A1H9NST5_9HYPH|nr:DEAD/DEAH box helicase [Faunimonas pinastri]SER38958.1 ATP-dependent RNA helicase RhlE [Faunimonas pinastri]